MAEIKINQKKIQEYVEGETGVSYNSLPHGITNSSVYEQSHWGYVSNGGEQEINDRPSECFYSEDGKMGMSTTYLPYSLDKVDDESKIDSVLTELVESCVYITPMEYYANISSDSSTNDDDEIGELLVSKNTEPKYFWVESLKNWCYFGKYDFSENTENDVCWYLYMWNGINGWDRVEDVVISPTKYLYKKKDLLGETEIDGVSVNTKLFRICNVTGSSRDSFTLNGNGVNCVVSFGLVLDKDSNYSVYDGTTFKVNRFYKDEFRDADRDYGLVRYCNGCPMVYRTSSGELIILFVVAVGGTTNMGYDAKNFRIYGKTDVKQDYHIEVVPSDYDKITLHSRMIMPTTNEQIIGCGIGRSSRENDRYYKDTIDYVNTYARNFFGKGDNKTIKNWKNYTYSCLLDDTNEAATDIRDINDETLYKVDSIVNVSVEMDTPVLKIEVPRPNPITETITTEDYVDRWSK